jgi:hypothetical protein
MADHPLTLHVPEDLYERLRQLAEASAQPVEAIAIQQLEATLQNAELANLPRDEQQELAAFNLLSDDTLQNILREQMPHSAQAQMQGLMDKNNFGTITPEEYTDLSSLVERGNRLMLRKAWAADVLMKRGYPISGQDFTALNG